MTKRVYVPDTNALLDAPDFILNNQVLLLEEVLKEITHLELKRSNKYLQKSIRDAKRSIRKALDNGNATFIPSFFEKEEGSVNDLNILNEIALLASSSKRTDGAPLTLVTSDILMSINATSMKIDYTSPFDKSKDDIVAPDGVYEFLYDPENAEHDELLSKIMETSNSGLKMAYNPFNLKQNQYVIIWDKSTEEINKYGKPTYKEVATFKFNGVRLVRLQFSKQIHTGFETVKPINVRQRLAFDLLQDKDVNVKLLTGDFGTGKDYLMLSHALHLIDKNKFDKIIWIRNNIEVKDTNPIGFLPDGMDDKLKPFIAPLIDKMGGEHGYDMIRDKVEVEHLGFLRGREFKNSIIYVTEAQSNTRDHIKLLLGRAGEGTEVWFNGDVKQTDSDKFSYDNGIRALSELTGEPLFGQVKLDKVERSETANLATLLDI